MAEYDVSAFRDLIREAIGNRTQSEFARDAGLTPQYLNRLLNSDDIGKPTKNTLMKLSGHSYTGIPLAKFLKVCGYEDSEETLKNELRSMNLKDRLNKCVNSLKAGFEKMSENRPVYDSLYEFVDMVFVIYGDESLSVKFNEHVFDVYKGEFGIAEHAVVATISWGDDYDIAPRVTGFDAEMDVLICYSDTTGGSVIIGDVKTDQHTLYEYGSDVVQTLVDMNDFREDGLACIIHKKTTRKPEVAGMSAEERLLYAIFGNTSGVTSDRIIQEEGYGFYLDDTPMYVIHKFIENHKGSMSKTVIQNYEESLKSVSDDHREDDNGYPCFAICAIMRKETGLHFDYVYSPEIDGEHQTILFHARNPWNYTDQEKELSEDSLRKIIDSYAVELRTEVQYCVAKFIGNDDYRL